MTQIWIAVLMAGGIVLVADLLTTHLRKRVQRESKSAEPSPAETDPEGRSDEEVALDRD